jgi:hypothetical protein
MKGLTRRKEKMIHPTKIHLAISNRTGTAQSSPHFLAIVVVHWVLAMCVNSSDRRRVREEQNEEKEDKKGKEEERRTCSDEIMVTATKISNP